MDAAQHAVDVYVHQLRPRVRVALRHLAGDVDAGVGEEHIDAAKARHGLRHHARHIRAYGHVGDDDQRIALEFLRQRREFVAGARGQRQPAAAAVQRPRRRRADPGTGAGDDDDFAGEWVGHELAP